MTLHGRRNLSWGLLLAGLAGGCGLDLSALPTSTRPSWADFDASINADYAYDPHDLPETARACVQLSAPRSRVHGDMHAMLNAYRAEHGLSRLAYSRSLEQAADQYAQQLFDEGFFSHVAPDGSEPADRAVAAGFCDRYVGENIAYGLNQVSSAQKAMEGFIGSPRHNENLLRPEWDYVGIGFLKISGFQGTEYWWVQLFGRESEPRP